MPLKRKRTARGKRAPRALSSVDWFCQQPEPPFAADSVVPPICSLFLEPLGNLYKKLQVLLAEEEQAQRSTPPMIQQRRPGPRNPAYGIPSSEWQMVLQRVLEKKEPLRNVADDDGVSHETIRRLVRAARRS